MSTNVIEQASSDTAINSRAPATGLAAILSGGRGETAKALAVAIANCKPVSKDGKNAFHKYKYATADAIIEEARSALSGAGLVLLPLEASLNGTERNGPDRFELVRTFVLLHSSGEMTPLRVCWPVVPDNGRPLDKATAIADTLSLSYLLRDLLLMPRVDPTDDMNARDDRSADKRAGKKPRPLPTDGLELERWLVAGEAKLVGVGRCKQGELIRFVCAAYARVFKLPDSSEVPPFPQWEKQGIELAIQAVKDFGKSHPPSSSAPANGAAPSAPARISDAQLKELLALMDSMGGTDKIWPRVKSAFALPALTLPGDVAATTFAVIVPALKEQKEADARFAQQGKR